MATASIARPSASTIPTGDEVHRLHDLPAWDDVEKAGFDDVSIRTGLARGVRRVGVGQHHPMRPARPGVEAFEPARHSVGWEPHTERLGIDEGGIDALGRGNDYQ
jgi:hypothetical protein